MSDQKTQGEPPTSFSPRAFSNGPVGTESNGTHAHPYPNSLLHISDPVVTEVKEETTTSIQERKKALKVSYECEHCGFQNEQQRRNGFRTWTKSECMVLEKWNLDYMVKYQLALTCAEYYWRCYRWLGIPASLCAFLTVPGQWLNLTENITQRNKTIFSVALGFLGLIGGCLSFLMITLKLAEKAQQYNEHADMNFRLYQRLERELDREWHDLSFLHYCRLLEMLEMQQKATLLIPPPNMKKKFQKMEEAILKERISLNTYEMKTIYRARKLRRDIINGGTPSKSPEEEKLTQPPPTVVRAMTKRLQDRLKAYDSSPDLTKRFRMEERV